MIKKVIAEKFCVVCPKCGKPALRAREFDNGTAEIEHSRKRSNVKAMGKYMWEVEVCLIKD